MVLASQIARHVAGDLRGRDQEITRVCAARPRPQALTFLKAENALGNAAGLQGLSDLVVLCSDLVDVQGPTLIRVAQPRLAFAQAVAKYFVPPPSHGGVSAMASIASTVDVGVGVSIGHFSVIEDNVSIGANTEIRDGVKIAANCVIGANCLLKSHAVLGEEGFGFEREAGGSYFRVPHLGTVELSDHVEVGAGTVIARGTIGATRVGHGTKIDDACFIAHNVVIGANCLIIAGAEISGSVRIGNDAWVAPNSSIINEVSIGDRAVIGLGAVVIRDVHDGEL